MNSKTKWIGAGAVILAAAAVIFWLGRGGETSPQAPRTTPAANPEPIAAPSPSAPAIAPAPQAPQTPRAPPVTAALQPGRSPNIPPYRPAHLLIYSEEYVSLDPIKDNDSKVLARIIAVTEADSAQAEQIRTLWKVHEDGRRELWKVAFPSKSVPRPLDIGGIAKLDFAFQFDLLGKVLRPEQGERLLEEVPPSPNH